ncbi:S1C family serine protease [Rhodococcoides yunnanense]|uniref:S1C family serine protease n=1 Tax=Rhodococcoides yunnanense TaxID=278209 RepID=UPI0022B1F96C|nr:trypsin-like peptidase domain-containing protein [Rhodococcus yunnanensis]MCZ4275694.1 trypsin-like peptidase domain-containing protein [Rhodococcus yunnanensis]
MQAVGRYAFVLALTFAASALAAPLGPGVLDAPEQTPPATAPPVALPPPPPPAPLTLEQLSAQIDPTIVTLSAEFGLYGVAGTGFVVDPDGLVLTNFHVVEEATDITAVHQGNGLIYDASVLGYDRTRDLAVLQLATASNLQVAAIGTSANVAVGDPVTAVGNADGAGALVPAPGKIVALDRSVLAQSSVNGSRNELTGMIQIDADVRSGDSGGPLVDAWGSVIGVDAAGLSEEARQTQAPEAYAIPIDDAMAVFEQVRTGRSGGTVHVGPTPYLGIGVRDVSAFRTSGPTQGAVIASVASDSPAERSGLLRGDVIVSFDGRAVRNSDELTGEMIGRRPGDRIDLEWVSEQGVLQQRTVTLEQGSPTA